MKKLFILFIAMTFVGCTNHLNVKVDDPKAKESLEVIMYTLPTETGIEFKNEYKDVLILSTIKSKGEVVIIDRYLKKYKHLTLGDLLEAVQKKTLKDTSYNKELK